MAKGKDNNQQVNKELLSIQPNDPSSVNYLLYTTTK